MTYTLEALGDEQFQRLAQALILRDFPFAQCLPVGQPDGGRDAYLVTAGQSGSPAELVVFQVKFSKNPKIKSEREAVEELIKLEAEKIERLKRLGLTRYIFITNVYGTAHPGTGSIDRVEEILSSRLGIPAQCWWGDDIERRIDGDSNVKWSFPQILRATDLLQVLVTAGGGEQAARRQNAIRAALTKQHRSELEVKFKEIELSCPLIDLFIDTPARTLSEGGPSREDFDDPRTGAAARLVRIQSENEVDSSIVLQGAPGQGKSTVTQYICQLYRMQFLGHTAQLEKIPELLRPQSLRLPIRADLRDFSAWMDGRVAFGTASDQMRPPADDCSLEAFLAALIHHTSGGIEFDVNDLHVTLGDTRVFIALDGFDEVADVTTRDAMITAIEEGAARLRQSCDDLQIIVTSRPSAFLNSLKFDATSWTHLELVDLTHQHIIQYTQKWAKVRKLTAEDKKELNQTLHEKLREPHIVELARNPMQLSILLSLMLKQGPSLPNKRTELYNDYVKLFFDRESQKSSIVKQYRSLLVSVHERLAYVLHADAEDADKTTRKVAPGTITLDDLKREVRTYLVDVGHPEDLLDGLFTGITERVVALVSRIQGTFEFPVQPLREYFASQYLYNTATVRPGTVAGSRPQRFRGIAKRAFWANVLRFYAGSYHSGELPSLIEETFALDDTGEHHLLSIGRQHAFAILSDYVFQDQPRLCKRYVGYIFNQPGLDYVLSWGSDFRLMRMAALPEGCGRGDVVAFASDALQGEAHHDRREALLRIIQRNVGSGTTELWRTWEDKLPSSEFLSAGNRLGVYDQLSVAELSAIEQKYHEDLSPYLALRGRWDFIMRSQEAFDNYLSGIMRAGASSTFWGFRHAFEDMRLEITRLFIAIDGSIVPTEHFGAPEERMTFGAYLEWYYGMAEAQGQRSELPVNMTRYSGIVSAVDAILDVPVSELRSNVEHRSRVMEAIRAVFGEQLGVLTLAANVVLDTSKSDGVTGNLRLLDAHESICGRLLFARHKAGDRAWWAAQIDAASSDSAPLMLLAAFSFAKWDDLQGHWMQLAALANSLSVAELSWLVRSLERAFRKGLAWSADLPSDVKRQDPRLALLFAVRYQDSAFADYLHAHLPLISSAEPAVAKSLAAIAAKAANQGWLNWFDVVPALRAAHQRGLAIYWSDTDNPVSLSDDLANAILDEPVAYPLALIRIADLQVRAAAERAAIPLRELATAEGWFAEVA